MHFQNADILFQGLWLLPVLVLLMWLGERWRRRRIDALIPTPELAAALTVSASPGRRRLRHLLLLAAALLLLMALGRPQWGTRLVQRPQRSRDVLVVMDTSRSMLARDVAPSRLEHARHLIRRLVTQTPGDRYGLIAFAGTAFLECPLTQDQSGFLLFLDDLSTDSIPVGGTNLEAALREALKAFRAAGGGHRAVILISDGDELQGDAESVLDEFREQQIPIFVVGLGDARLGSYIQIEGNRFVTDAAGDRVRTKLNEAGLQALSAATGGTYIHSTAVHDGLEHLVERVRGLVPEEHEDSTVSRPIERYQIPLLLAVLCLLVRLMVGERRSAAAAARLQQAATAVAATLMLSWTPASNAAAPNQAAPALPPGLPGLNQPLAPAAPAPQQEPADEQPAQPSLSDAKRKLVRQAIDELKQRLDKAETQRERAYCHYNLGVNLMALGEQEDALSHFELALAAAHDDRELRGRAYRNLGVAAHRQAREQGAADPDKALAGIEEAQGYYREAMRALPADGGAARNQELAVRDAELFRQIKKMQEQLRQQQQDALEKTRQAKESQDKANQSAQQGERQQQQQQQAADQTGEAEQAARQLADAARQQGQDQAAQQVDAAADALKKAAEKQQQALDKSRPAEERKESAEQAAEQLAQAYRQLGGKAPEEKPQEGEQQNGEQQAGNEQEKPEEQPDTGSQQANAGNAAEQQADANDVAGSEGEEELDVDKAQALHILQEMQAREKDLKERLKVLEKQAMRHQRQVEKDW